MTPEQQRAAAALKLRAQARLRLQAQKHPGVVGTIGDVAGGAATGLTKGLLDIPAMPFDLANLAQQGFDKALDYGVDVGRGVLHLPPLTDEQRQERAAGRDQIRKGPMQKATDAAVGAYHQGVESLPLPQPHTDLGKAAERGARFVPMVAGTGPSGIVRYALIPWAASEAGGAIARTVAPGNTKAEALARGTGAVVGGGISSLSAPGAYAQRFAGRAAADVTDAQWQAADALMRDAATRGITLTPAEAVQQVTGGATRLGDVQRIVESTTEGGRRMAPAMAARPGQIEQAGRNVINQIGPQSPDPLYQGVQAQNTAQQVLTNARQANNAVAEPYYRALDPNGTFATPGGTGPLTGMFVGPRISQAEQAQLMANPRYAAALAELRAHPEIGPQFARLPDDSVAMVNEVVKRLDRGVEASRQTALNPEGDNYLSALRQDARTQADTAAANASPDYRTARDLVRQGNETIVDPLNAGVVGQVARTSEVPSQIGAIMPLNPVPGSARETTRAVTDMMGVNPDVTRGTVRAGVEQTFNRSTRPDPQGRPDQYGGARFAREMTGERAPNVRAAVTGAAGPHVQQELDSLVQALAATGWRPRPGSLTAFNAEALKDMSKGGVDSLVQALVKPLTTAKDAVARARLGRQSELLADILLSGPEGLARLRGLARHRAIPGPLARALIQSTAATQAP